MAALRGQMRESMFSGVDVLGPHAGFAAEDELLLRGRRGFAAAPPIGSTA